MRTQVRIAHASLSLITLQWHVEVICKINGNKISCSSSQQYGDPITVLEKCVHVSCTQVRISLKKLGTLIFSFKSVNRISN